MTFETPASAQSSLDDSIDLLDVAVRFLVEWRRLLLTAVVLFALFVAVIYSMTSLFEASAVIIPESKTESNSLSSALSQRSTGDVFLGLLNSRSVADGVIDRAGLMAYYHTKSRGAARGMLAKRSVFAAGTDTLVTIRVRDKDAGVAQHIANAYLDALQEQQTRMLSEDADFHRKFFEEQMAAESASLAEAERDLERTEVQSGIVQPEAQTTIGLNAIASTQQQITALEVQLASLRLGASEQNPQVKALESEIGTLQGKESAMESDGAAHRAGAAASAGKMPELNLEYNRKLRAVKNHELVLNSIASQYEGSRLSEGYTGLTFAVVDRAIAPEGPAWPPRKMLLWLAAFFSLIAGAITVAATMLWRTLMLDPIQRQRVAILRDSLRRSPGAAVARP